MPHKSGNVKYGSCSAHISDDEWAGCIGISRSFEAKLTRIQSSSLLFFAPLRRYTVIH